MMAAHSSRKILILSLCSLAWLPALAYGDGGTARFSGNVGDYRMTIFTEPTPLRAGPVDVSVLLQDRQTGGFVTDAAVTISVSHADRPLNVNRVTATTASATNKLFQAASFEFAQPGTWNISVEVDGNQQTESSAFELNVAPRVPRWVDFIFWIGFPVIPIALFGVRESVRYRQARAPSPATAG